MREGFSSINDIPTYPVRISEKSGFILNGEILEVAAAIPLLHGDFGEDGKIQGALSTAHIPFVGCECFSGAVASDKIYSKIIAEHLSVPTVKWVLADKESTYPEAKKEAEESIGYPMFIKPPTLGSSIGAHKVSCEKEFKDAFLDAKSSGDGRVLIEKYVDTVCEIECAVFYDKKMLFAPYGRICTDGAVYDYLGKYENRSSPTVIHGKGVNPKEEKIIEYSKRIAEFLMLRHLSRIDFFLSSDGEIYFNEINTFPGMTSTSLYPLITEDMGYGYGEFINILLEETLS